MTSRRTSVWSLTFFFVSATLAVFLARPPSTALAAGFQSAWVKTTQPTQLWSGPNSSAVAYGGIATSSYLLVVAPQQLTRLYVYVPWTQNYAYVDVASVTPSSPPPPTMSPAQMGGPLTTAPSANWLGTVVAGGARIRPGPSLQSPVLKIDPAGTIVNVVAWVAGDAITPGDWTWAKLADGTYAYGEALQIIPPTTPPAPPANHPNGQWIDVNTLLQTVVAYNGNMPVYLAIGSTGSPGWETQPGVHAILRRVANETMDSSTLVGLDPTQRAQADYHLTNVLYTQYFDDNADALHDNYWLPVARFGMPHSHGCVGLRLSDALWFWNWASTGTPVIVH